MLDYEILKRVHQACVALSVAGFVARFALIAADSPLSRSRFARVAPHLVDTVLLASAASMVALVWWPLPDWVVAKLIALVAYVVLGSFALRRARTAGGRAAAFAAAHVVVAYLVAVALSKRPF